MAANHRKKKTKLEKIAELEGGLKVLKEENKRLRREIHSMKAGKNAEDGSIASDAADGQSLASTAPGDEREKLRDALVALKRVTMKQEMSLSKFRARAKQRRAEIETKDSVIEKLQKELGWLKSSYAQMRGSSNDDVSRLKAQLVGLQLQLANEKACHEDQAKQLSQSRHDVSTLQGQLAKAKVTVPLNSSPRSLRSESTSASTDSTARLRRELADKIEKIANLECELEEARDRIHEIRRNKQFDESFPVTPAPGQDDFFSDDEEEDDYWGN